LGQVQQFPKAAVPMSFNLPSMLQFEVIASKITWAGVL
jgi:hypothetical protein